MHVIRKAIPADARGLFELIHEHAAFEQSVATISLQQLIQWIAASTIPIDFFVAEFGSEVAGYASLTLDHSTWRGTAFGHLDCLYVRDRYRGSGIGKELFHFAAEAARDAGADRLEWQTPAWNEDAARFYKREGGVAEPKQRFHLLLYSELPRLHAASEDTSTKAS